MGARWLKNILISGSLAQLRDAVEANAARFGFRYFIYRGHFPGGSDVRLDNCVRGWSEAYGVSRDECDRLLGIDDPYEATPRLWSQMAHGAPGFFARARELGLVSGSTHPVHGPGGEWSSVSFVKDYGGARAESEIRTALARCQLLATYVHDCVRRIVWQGPAVAIAEAQPVQDTSDLNERECQVLTWVAAGKTSSEIASLMPISERTVSFHLSNARRKLGAANSRHAITRAISLGLIDGLIERPDRT